MTWWIWVILGFALTLAELFTPGLFVLLFFGLGAIIVGLVLATGIVSDPSMTWFLFPIISIILLVIFRKRLLLKLGAKPSPILDGVIGEELILRTSLAPHATGQASFRGTTWQVENGDAVALQAGSTVVIKEISGITLILQEKKI